MTSRGRRRRLGCALGLAMGVTLGCLQEDEFVAEYAVEVCRMVRDCDRVLYLPDENGPIGANRVRLPATSECEAMVEAHYSTCRSDCDFRKAKARRCLRRLRDNACDLGNESVDEEDIPLVCGDVFESCAGGLDQDAQCGAPRCSVGASSSAGAGLLWMLGLVGLGARARRRQRP